MKKFLIIIIILIILVTLGFYVFKNNKQDRQTDIYGDNAVSESKDTASNHFIKKTEINSQNNVLVEGVGESKDLVSIAGSYLYYMNKNYTPAGFGDYTFGKVCFEPAQMETFNDGDIFCFKNTDEALSKLEINKSEIDLSCKKYWNGVKVRVSSLTSGNKPTSKTDECFINKSCRYEEAEFKEVVSFFKDSVSPKCDK